MPAVEEVLHRQDRALADVLRGEFVGGAPDHLGAGDDQYRAGGCPGALAEARLVYTHGGGSSSRFVTTPRTVTRGASSMLMPVVS